MSLEDRTNTAISAANAKTFADMKIALANLAPGNARLQVFADALAETGDVSRAKALAMKVPEYATTGNGQAAAEPKNVPSDKAARLAELQQAGAAVGIAKGYRN